MIFNSFILIYVNLYIYIFLGKLKKNYKKWNNHLYKTKHFVRSSFLLVVVV